MPTLINVSRNKALAIVDDADVALVSQYHWKLTLHGYAIANINGIQTLMHRLVCDSADKPFIDHKNGQRLDNRRANLRPCTHRENMGNRRKGRENTSSQYIGVTWHKQAEKWLAICAGQSLGNFENEVDAAIIRDEVALERYGEFAKLNFPEGPPANWVRPAIRQYEKIGNVLQTIGDWDDKAITKQMIMRRLGVSPGTAVRYINHLVENDQRWEKTFTEVGGYKMGRPAIIARRANE